MKTRELETLQAHYDEARSVLDTLTTEQARIAGTIAAAIQTQDFEGARTLTKRKKTLPALVEEARAAVDRAGIARDEVELARVVEQVGPAEAELTRLSEELAAKQAEYDAARDAHRALLADRRTLEMNISDRRRREAQRAAAAA
jgi:hypothetical protein